ncbi:HNH endonuclease signature motif containing protein [Actinomycetospora flava]|uniref:DUF222 domain-containing protein n=1 Tax=Actinomycetospora flava TaxID=3129232 RepID=A0ABU8MAJ0_9PSEU
MFEGFVDESAPAALAGVLPGPELGEHLIAAELLAPDPSPADHSPDGDAAWRAAVRDGLDRVAGWARMSAWAQAQEMMTVESLVSGAVARAERRPPGTLLDDHVGGVGAEVDSVTAELALTWQVAGRTATRRVDEAVSLVGGLPLLVEAMLDGRLGLAHVRAVAGVLLDLDPELRERICRDLLEGTAAGRQIARTPAQLAGAARRAAIRLDPASARRRERAEARERGVHLGAEDHGMATVTAYLPAAEALLLYRTIDAHARVVASRDDEGERSPDARRADALTDLVTLGALAAAGAVAEPAEEAGDGADADDRGGDPGAGSCACPPPGHAARRPAEDAAENDPAENDAAENDAGALVPAPRRPDDEGTPATSSPAGRPPTERPPAGTTPASPPPSPPPSRPRDRPRARPRGAPSGSPGRRGSVQVRVVVSADTLLGFDERPAELVGYGPITAEAARALAAEADATWRRVLTDPLSGAVVDVGHRRYRPPAAMADHVRHRDLHCTFPGCRVPAQACDLDHLVPFRPGDPGGRTAADNLGPECRHHHRIKHLPGWTVARGPGGSVVWTTPSGRRYRTIRPVLLPATPDTVPTPTPAPAPTPAPTPTPRPSPPARVGGRSDDPPF